MSAGQLVLQNVINRYGLIVMTGYSVSFRINGLIVNSVRLHGTEQGSRKI